MIGVSISMDRNSNVVKSKIKSTQSQTVANKRARKLTLRLRYHTNFGQSIFVTGSHPLLGDGDIEKALPLQYLNEEFWQVTFTLPANAADTSITYNYFVSETNGALTHDWGMDKAIKPFSFTQAEVVIIDSWNYAGYFENAFYTKSFRNVLLRGHHASVKPAVSENPTHIFRVKAPLLNKRQTLCLVGNHDALHNWSVTAPVLMSKNAGEDHFTAQLDLRGATFPAHYKYGIYDAANHKFVRFESVDLRTLHDSIATDKLTIINDGFAALPANTWKGAGVAIPVFSLRSEAGFGVGEFNDLKLLVDWSKQAGLKLIQLLPINDTMATHTWVDSYPYAAISAFALHPLYLNLEKLAEKSGKAALQKLEPERKRLNALDALDYEGVMKCKSAFIEKMFLAQKKVAFNAAEYQEFFENNRHWLEPYAAFCYLRDKFGTADFNQWPSQSKYDAKEITKLAAKDSAIREALDLRYFTQYHLHCQLQEATDYARSQGVVVKGDLPIGIHRHGADAWQNPELYHMDMQAGAPPDPFAAKGQNWGFPTYNWDRMRAGGFAWWKHRCEQMSRYFDAFRIDHILGFFRIWSIPTNAVEGILGFFVPAIPVEAIEFTERGIPFDQQRYCSPLINDRVLAEMFPGSYDEIKRKFLKADDSGNYILRPEFRTQRQVEAHFARLDSKEHNEKLKIALYDLISNVLLFEVAGSQGRQFHFRLGMEETTSFKQLTPDTQARLKDLYVNYFFRRQDDFWAKQAMQKLPALKRVTDMLVCGEDLGMVPDCVPEVMRQLGLLSLEIQRMPKNPKKEFSYPKDAPYLSVVTPSTHDMSTIRGWWEEEDRIRLRKFYQAELGQSGEPPKLCDGWINRAIIIQHLESPAMWSIFQLQDLLGMDETLRRKNPNDERINVPANTKNYWRYRMHISLEKLNQERAFTGELKEYVEQNGR